MFFQEASTFSTDEQVFEEALQAQDDQQPDLDLEVQDDSQTSTDSNSDFDPLEIADTSDTSDTSSSSSLYFDLLPDIIDDVNEELIDEFWPPNVVDELIADHEMLATDFAHRPHWEAKTRQQAPHLHRQ